MIVFERDAVIGGRARTVDLGGRRVDLGATAISTLNHYLLNFTAGMKRRAREGPSTLAIYDGSASVSKVARVRCLWPCTSR